MILRSQSKLNKSHINCDKHILDLEAPLDCYCKSLCIHSTGEKKKKINGLYKQWITKWRSVLVICNSSCLQLGLARLLVILPSLSHSIVLISSIFLGDSSSLQFFMATIEQVSIFKHSVKHTDYKRVSPCPLGCHFTCSHTNELDFRTGEQSFFSIGFVFIMVMKHAPIIQ